MLWFVFKLPNASYTIYLGKGTQLLFNKIGSKS